MYVYERMSKDPVTVRPENSVSKAFQIMMETRHSQLIVVNEDNRLAGIITGKLIAEVNPDKATTLSQREINYLLKNTKVRDIMRSGAFRISKDSAIEQAALIMKENRMGFLPVTDSEDKVIGIITRNDIFKAFLDILGIKHTGLRICIKLEDKKLSQVLAILEDMNVQVISISNFSSSGETVIKTSGGAEEDIDKKLSEKGINVISVAQQH